MSGIYLHIPFCKQACSYCDFYFVTRTSEQEAFVDRLVSEIESYRDSDYAQESVETIYFGGGTPSLLKPAQVQRILGTLDEVFDLKTHEITFEMNPDDVTANYLRELSNIGISRASMGVQSFQPELLEFMNRAHNRQEALQCLEILSTSGFSSFTVDLIYGNPGQTLAQLDEDLDLLLEFQPPHISAYSLTIEDDTRLGKQVELGRLVPPEDDRVADHFALINERIGEAGMERYEVSNYAKPGQEALHNSHYWTHRNYLGFGPGAHSFWWNDEAERWKNDDDLRKYLKDDNIRADSEQLNLHQLAEERLMMGLRTRQGVEIQELAQTYDYELNDRQQEYLQSCRQKSTMKKDENRIALTDEGIIIADAIILDMITLH